MPDEMRSPTLNGVSHQRVEIPLSVSNFGKDLAIFDFGRSAFSPESPRSLAHINSFKTSKVRWMSASSYPTILQYFSTSTS